MKIDGNKIVREYYGRNTKYLNFLLENGTDVVMPMETLYKMIRFFEFDCNIKVIRSHLENPKIKRVKGTIDINKQNNISELYDSYLFETHEYKNDKISYNPGSWMEYYLKHERNHSDY